MSYLIDTNVISEIRKGKDCNLRVAQWHRGVGQDDIFLSVVVIGEIRKGIEKLRLRNPTQAAKLEDWLLAVQVALGNRVLPITVPIADLWGRISASRSLPIIDSLMAATAKVHGLTVVTRNAADFAGLDVAVLNPFA